MKVKGTWKRFHYHKNNVQNSADAFIELNKVPNSEMDKNEMEFFEKDYESINSYLSLSVTIRLKT